MDKFMSHCLKRFSAIKWKTGPIIVIGLKNKDYLIFEFWYVCMRSGSKWPMIGPRPCACAYVDPVFTSQNYDISTSTRRTNLSVFLVLMLMSTQFSRAYYLITKLTGTLAGMKFTFGTRRTEQRTFHDLVLESYSVLKFTFPLVCAVHQRFMHVLSWNIFF